MLDVLETLDRNEKTVVVIDEYPLLSRSEPGIDSILQTFIDHRLSELNIFLIICGSSISAMIDTMNDMNAPLFGRFPVKIKLEPLSFKECIGFHPDMSVEDMIRVYSIVGGVPFYQKLMSKMDLDECIKDNFLGPVAYLREDAMDLILQELRPHDTCVSIIEAISRGRTVLKEISEYAGITPAMGKRCIENMIVLGIVSVVTPMENSPRRPVYRICDNLVRFYCEVLMPNMSMVVRGSADKYLDELRPYLDQFYGAGFEEVCEQYLTDNWHCLKTGRWWGRCNNTDTDIDIIADVRENDATFTLACECKFTSSKVGRNIFRDLEDTVGSIPGIKNVRYVIFSRSGFTNDLMEMTEYRKDLGLICLDELVR